MTELNDTIASLPRLIVHTPAHVAAATEAARAAGRRIILQSPPDCPRRAGVPWFLALVAGCGDGALPVLDCGCAPGLALAALRAGAPVVRLEAPVGAPGLLDIARQLGALVDTAPAPPLLDLRQEGDPAAACRRFLGLA